jgi:sec-independent protein translocase protein TatC
MTLTEHLAELRVRIIRAMLAVALGMITILAFYDPVLRFLLRPYRNLCERKGPEFCTAELFALGPLEGFSARVRIALWGGVLLALPVILWQIWRFVVPALHANEKRYAVPFILSSVLLFLLGGTLAFLTIDKALEFLISWSGSEVNEAFQITRYVSLVGLMVAAFGIGFLFPVLLVFLQLVGVVSPQQLLKQWRVAVMAVFVVAAVITPSGDPVSLLLLSVPMTILFFVSVGVGFFVERRRAGAGVAL